MPSPRENSIWGKIRVQLGQAQQMILNGKYAEAMVLNKEILETIVRMQVDKACLVTNTLENDIEQLFNARLISRKTRDNYHAIRIYGEQAQSGEEQTPQAANDSFALMKEELGTYVDQNQRSTAASQAAVSQTVRPQAAAAGRVQERAEEAEARGAEADAVKPASQMTHRERYEASQAALNVPINGGSTAGQNGARRVPASSNGTARTQRPARPVRPSDNRHAAQAGGKSSRTGSAARTGTGARTSGRTGRNQRSQEPVEIDIYSILKIVIPVACIILLIILIRVLATGGKPEVKKTTAAPVETVQESPSAAETEPETPAETTPAETQPQVTKLVTTTSGVRVRSTPGTGEGSRLLAQLDKDTEVEYIGDQDDKWAKIRYDGQEAYISKEYVKPAA